MVLWRSIRPSRTNIQKRCPFHYSGLECKSRTSRATWRNRQVWPWSTKWSRAKANRVLQKECTGHSKHPLPTTQEKTLHMDITDGQYRNQIDYVLCSQRRRSSIQSAKQDAELYCGSDHELIAKFRLKLNKVGKTTWRRKWQPTPVLLPGKSHGWRSLIGCHLWGCEESNTTEWLHFHFSLPCIGEENGNPLQCSCLENPRDGGAWWAAVYGVAQSWTRLKQLSSSSSRENH